MEFLRTYGKEIISLLVPIITWILNVGLKGKAALIWTSPHSFTFLIQEPRTDAEGNVISPMHRIATASIRIKNTGRETATKIELVFNWKPHHINLWPVRHYEQKTETDNRFIMIFDNLSPKEEIGLEILSINGDLPELLLVRSAECTAQNVQLLWIRHVSAFKIALARFLIFIGIGASIYAIIVLIQLLVLKTPSY